MAKDEYLDSLTAKMRYWREQIEVSQDDELGAKFEEIMNLLAMYQRMGASAWREEEQALDRACSELERAFPNH